MSSIITHSSEETQAVGEKWGRVAESGWVIGLSGDLGAGKTQLVKGFALGLGISDKISSPTFALVNEYSSGRLPLFHLDLYRLDTREQIVAAGLEDYLFQVRGVSIVEWIERWAAGTREPAARPMGKLFRSVTIEQLGETERRITYEDFRS